MVRAQVAAYLGDIKNLKCVQDAKPDEKEYFAFIATRLVKKLRLDGGVDATPEPVATKPAATGKVLNAMDLRPDLKAAKDAVAKEKAANAKPAAKAKPRTKADAAAVKRLSQHTNASAA